MAAFSRKRTIEYGHNKNRTFFLDQNRGRFENRGPNLHQKHFPVRFYCCSLFEFFSNLLLEY